jgi:hypothetical protein
MKRKFNRICAVLVMCCTFIINSTYAQQEMVHPDSKLYIGISGGLSVPMGNFARTDYADSKSGFAKMGGNIGITGTCFLTKHFGITALVSYQGYGFKSAQNLANGYKEDFAVDSATATIQGSNYTIDALVGPYYSCTLRRNLFLDVRALAGITSAHLAGNTIYLEDQTAATFGQKESAATALAVQFGAAIRYNLCKHWGVSLGLDYFSSKPDFSIENTNRKNEAGRIINSYHQPMQGINTNLGLVYRF